MNRLLIESIEGRILLGITMFVSIMILIGWVGINEPARMAAFDRQQLGRSIERGAELYAANCATCHSADGRGIVGRAPGLNSPHLFGVDFLRSLNGDMAVLERDMLDARLALFDLNRERDALLSELGQIAVPPAGETAEQKTAREARVTEITVRVQEISALTNAATPDSPAAELAAIEAELAPLYTERDAQLAGMQVAFDSGYLPELGVIQERAAADPDQQGLPNPLLVTQYIASESNRLKQMGWEGALDAYVRTTLIHGRPGSADVWDGNQMVSWAQAGGGPLRYDQVDDIVNYIMNFDKGSEWTLEDLFAVRQFGKVKQEWSPGGASEGVAAVGPYNDAAVAAVVALTGDPVRGEALYTGGERTQVGRGTRLGCTSCHLGGAQAPATELTWTNVTTVRLADPVHAGYTPEQYLVQSILAPNAYVVAPYASGVMPQNYNEQMSAQDLADVIAYLRSYAEAGS